MIAPNPRNLLPRRPAFLIVRRSLALQTGADLLTGIEAIVAYRRVRQPDGRNTD